MDILLAFCAILSMFNIGLVLGNKYYDENIVLVLFVISCTLKVLVIGLFIGQSFLT